MTVRKIEKGTDLWNDSRISWLFPINVFHIQWENCGKNISFQFLSSPLGSYSLWLVCVHRRPSRCSTVWNCPPNPSARVNVVGFWFSEVPRWSGRLLEPGTNRRGRSRRRTNRWPFLWAFATGPHSWKADFHCQKCSGSGWVFHGCKSGSNFLVGYNFGEKLDVHPSRSSASVGVWVGLDLMRKVLPCIVGDFNFWVIFRVLWKFV